MSVVFINCFRVPAGRDEEFLALWTVVNDFMRHQDGYVGHRLHRALSDDAEFRFVNVAEWASAEQWAAAHSDRVRQLVADPAWAEFATVPALFEPIATGPG